MVTVGRRSRFAIASRDGRRDVDGWALVGADGVAIHRDGMPGWTVTHVASGMRLPREFGTRADACHAMTVLLELCPDALEIMGRIAARSQSRDDSQRIRDAWVVASDGDGRVQQFARIRYEMARYFGGSWDAAASRVLEDIGAADDGWTYDGDALSCPCGHTIEDDGSCPSGHVSPFRAAGLV